MSKNVRILKITIWWYEINEECTIRYIIRYNQQGLNQVCYICIYCTSRKWLDRNYKMLLVGTSRWDYRLITLPLLYISGLLSFQQWTRIGLLLNTERYQMDLNESWVSFHMSYMLYSQLVTNRKPLNKLVHISTI